ncbi:MAG: antibiotic biosynthesis monooxygenase [Desulfovibrio sp.]|jgi:quinol monooxygenase YgiN|nr:antibiotic biosynthesis monooxygenase [Desulfovibrio sp.]
MYALSVMLEIDPARREEFKAAVLRHAANTRTMEKDCLAFEVYESSTDPARFYLHEVYASKAAVTEIHAVSPSMAEYSEKTAAWIRKKVWEEWNSLPGSPVEKNT